MRGENDIVSVCNLPVIYLAAGTKSVKMLHAYLRLWTRFKIDPILTKCLYLSLFALVLVVGSAPLPSQQIANLLHQRNEGLGQGIEFGMDKITNTFVWTGNIDARLDTDFGVIRWTDQFRSSAFRTVTLATRDDQNSQVSWMLPLSEHFKTFIRQGWILSRDSRSVGLNSLERINGAAGLRFSPDNDYSVEVLGGLEQSTQLGNVAVGPLLGVVAQASNIALDQWQFSASGVADWQKLDEARTNTDVDIQANVVHEIDENSSVRVSVQSITLGREFFSSLGGPGGLGVERRLERKLIAESGINYAPVPWLVAGMQARLESNGADRSFNNPDTLTLISSVERQLRELSIDVEGFLRANTASGYAQLGASIFTRTEQNGVNNVHAIAASDLEVIRRQEFQRDNQAVRTRLFGRAEFRPSEVDTIRLDANGWLIRYDTPSASNDDDRDELATVLSASYARKLSEVTSFSLGVSAQYLHLVFLKASRSALNNTNRVIRLTPTIHINGSVVRMQPQIEILANYTVYDYEGTSSSVRSFSFRQLSLRDSVRVQLTPLVHAESQILVRYFERSSLQWSTFAELPETGNLEYLLKLLIFTQPSAYINVGAGLRLYTLDQYTIAPGLPSQNMGTLHSAGPEVALRYSTLGGSILTLSGWYEFQRINEHTTRELPNVLLRAVIRL